MTALDIVERARLAQEAINDLGAGPPTFVEEALERFPEAQVEGLSVTITATMKRTKRQKCSVCGLRRVCYYLDMSGYAAGLPMCAKDAGIR